MDIFDAMDAVLGHKPFTCPSFVIDTSADIEDRQEVNNTTLFTQQLVVIRLCHLSCHLRILLSHLNFSTIIITHTLFNIICRITHAKNKNSTVYQRVFCKCE